MEQDKHATINWKWNKINMQQ